MGHINIEIKARSADNGRIRGILKAQGADFRGLDHQIDTYFKVPSGRLKLREGNIEHNLIYYQRSSDLGPKQSDIMVHHIVPGTDLKNILIASLGVLAVVDKQREIYFIDNVKFHLDNVWNLGDFVEIEAIDKVPSIGREKLLEQCNRYMALLGISEADLVSCSYSDLLLRKFYPTAL